MRSGSKFCYQVPYSYLTVQKESRKSEGASSGGTLLVKEQQSVIKQNEAYEHTYIHRKLAECQNRKVSRKLWLTFLSHVSKIGIVGGWSSRGVKAAVPSLRKIRAFKQKVIRVHNSQGLKPAPYMEDRAKRIGKKTDRLNHSLSFLRYGVPDTGSQILQVFQAVHLLMVLVP